MSRVLVLSDGLIRSCLPEAANGLRHIACFLVSPPNPGPLSLFIALLVGSEILGSGVRHFRELLSPVLGPNHPPTTLRKRLRECPGTGSPAACKPGDPIWGVLTGYQDPVPPIRELTELTLLPMAAVASYTCAHTCVHMYTHSYTCMLTCIHTIHTYPITYMLTNLTLSHSHMYSHTQSYIHPLTHIHIRIHTHMLSHSYTHIHSYAHNCPTIRNVLCWHNSHATMRHHTFHCYLTDESARLSGLKSQTDVWLTLDSALCSL